MPYVVGILLSLSVALFARRVGFDRDRAFYPTVLIVIASYYVLFAVMSESVQTVLLESMVMAGFSIAAVVGFRSSAWIVVGGLAGHGVFDALSSARSRGLAEGARAFVRTSPNSAADGFSGCFGVGIFHL